MRDVDTGWVRGAVSYEDALWGEVGGGGWEY